MALTTLPPRGERSPQLRTFATLRQRARTGDLELPVLPASAAEVIRLTHDDRATPRHVAAAIRRDVSLTAHILRIANSPLYRSSSPIHSLDQAVARLGFGEVRNLALTVACRTRVFSVRGYEVDVRRTFRHSFAAALFCYELARGRAISGEEAFLVGLLHDVGEPILIQLAVDLARSYGENLPRAMLLSEVHSLHAEVGERLMRLWKISELAATVTLFHHAPHLAPPELALGARLVALADDLADFALASGDGGGPIPQSPHAEALGIGTEALRVLATRASSIRGTVDALT